MKKIQIFFFASPPSSRRKKEKKTKDKYANHEDFSRPQNSYKILFSPSPLYSQVAESGV
jgi:hypothetical protein